MDANSDALSDVEQEGLKAATLTECSEAIRCDGERVWCTHVGEYPSVAREDLLQALYLLRYNSVQKVEFTDVTVLKMGDNSVDVVFGDNRRACCLSDELRAGGRERGIIEFLELFE